MLRGLYTAASGMMAKQVQIDTIANNLANANVPGYRKDEAIFRSFPQMLLSRFGDRMAGVSVNSVPVPVGLVGTGSVLDRINVSFEAGALRETGNQLDFAIQGDAYFAVRGPDGNVLITRNGSFMLDGSGRLVTSAGYPVLGRTDNGVGEIYVPDGTLEAGKDGSLKGAATGTGEEIRGFYLVGGPEGNGTGQGWQKIGDTLFRAPVLPGEPAGYSVFQGFLEGSNVNPLEEMVTMITAMRSYEAAQKVIQATDGTLEKLINEVGRI